MHSKTQVLLLGSIFFIAYSSTLLAEVSDKIIQPNTMLINMVVFSLLGFFLNKKWPLWFPLIAAITIFFSSQGLATILDQYVGPAAIREQGSSYMYIAYLEFGFVVMANLIGVFLGFRKRVKKHA